MKTEQEKRSEARMKAFKKELFQLMRAHWENGLTLEEAGMVMAQEISYTLQGLNENRLNPENKLADEPEAHS